MNLLQQIIQLLSEPPGNVVYHLLTLFALQAVLALSLGQWRRNKDNRAARHTLIAAVTLVFSRVLLLVVSLVLADNSALATAVLPPLEQALNTLAVILLAWALVPSSQRWPRLGNVLLLLALLMLTVMYASFSLEWRGLSGEGLAYNGTRQATIWAVVQIAILAAAWIAALVNGRTRSGLAPIILGALLLAHLAHLWNYPELIPADTDIPYWIRLGHLVAFPLWAVLVYRHSLIPLLATHQASLPAVRQLAQSLEWSANVIGAPNENQRQQHAIRLAAKIMDVTFVGIGTIQSDDTQTLYVTSNLPQAQTDAPRSWQIPLADWNVLQTTLNGKQAIELSPAGSGSRQLHRLYDFLNIGPLGALRLEPLRVNDKPIGLLLLGLPDGRLQWNPRERALTPALARYLAQAIDNSRAHAEALRHASQSALPPLPHLADDESAVSGRIIALEEERTKLVDRLETANSRLLQAETRAATATKRAHDLADALAEMEQISRDDQITALEEEIATLRESLIEAEEAMALASAGEGGLSAEWVMMTITRYSGQLEEAQAKIQSLEAELARRDPAPPDELLTSLIQELRTPMTSIGGFTDLLLGETMGILGVKQRDFLQRIKANTERMGALLDQMLQMIAVPEQAATPEEEPVDVREVLETAVNSVITQIREKNLHLDFDVAEDLPKLAVNRSALHQILTNLLGNACQASAKNSNVMIKAQANSIPDSSVSLQENIPFLHLTITDSGGGIQPEDLPRVFDAHHRADNPLIAGLGDTGAGLTMAQELTQANGGRLWVESQMGEGSTFSVLFPISAGSQETADSAANGNIKGIR